MKIFEILKPKVYYTGTKSSEHFEEFSHRFTGGIGFHFTTEYNQAKSFGERVIAAHLNIKNPAPLEKWREALNKSSGGNPRKMAVDMLKKQGYDAVINPHYETIVFEPEQIKIINQNVNNGDDNG